MKNKTNGLASSNLNETPALIERSMTASSTFGEILDNLLYKDVQFTI